MIFTGSPRTGKTVYMVECIADLEKMVFGSLGGDVCNVVIVCRSFEKQPAIYNNFQLVPNLKVFKDIDKNTKYEIDKIRDAYPNKHTIILIDDMFTGNNKANQVVADFLSSIIQEGDATNTVVLTTIHNPSQIPGNAKESGDCFVSFKTRGMKGVKQVAELIQGRKELPVYTQLLNNVWEGAKKKKYPCLIMTKTSRPDPEMYAFYTNSEMRLDEVIEPVLDLTMGFEAFENYVGSGTQKRTSCYCEE